ncbi:hypothetical protein U8527_16445 [Kordia algicida OT-1]|uniref:Uncharacterized protein n=1 Tax=Kordia algicida OT-1 TaxID=391587 RepID=A9ECP0_9FLAO|nr:hypothetical protein [Kordia algicida]EDP94395.1 hypothetical protein KAOT1_10111 [Kordia algicida OT-1]
MKKQIKTLGLKKQTVSSLEARLLKGGAPTTMTMWDYCASQLVCEPLPPQQPEPGTNPSYSNCDNCGKSWLRC